MIKLEGPKGQRLVEEGKPYRLLPREKIIGMVPNVLKPSILKNKIGVGDLIAALLLIIGIRKKKGCGCDNRQKRWNKYRIKVPNWIIKLIHRGLAWHS